MSAQAAHPPQDESNHAILAFTLPFVVFLLLTWLESFAQLRPYYPWLYALKIAIVLGCWLRFRPFYPRWSKQGIGSAFVFGVVGVLAWIALTDGLQQLNVTQRLPGWLSPAARVGFDPFAAELSPIAAWAFWCIRMFGLACVVPLMEEVFWRGFLLRWLIDDDFQQVEWGRVTPWSFLLVTAGFTAAHPELLAALVWGAGINWLYRRTKNLWACIVAHSVTNLLLGVYILAGGSWHLW